jgi:hypothetical protein
MRKVLSRQLNGFVEVWIIGFNARNAMPIHSSQNPIIRGFEPPPVLLGLPVFHPPGITP